MLIKKEVRGRNEKASRGRKEKGSLIPDDHDGCIFLFFFLSFQFLLPLFLRSGIFLCFSLKTKGVARLGAHLRGAAFPGLPGQAAEG